MDLDKLRNAKLIFVEIKYRFGEHGSFSKVIASGWYASHLECFVFQHKSDIFYYYPDSNELYHCYDLWYLYKIREIGYCTKINDFEIKIEKIID